MKRGPLFRLLGLERALCPSCHRDNIWRHSRRTPLLCRWCGSSMVDWAAFTRFAQKLADAFATAFLPTARRMIQAFNAFATALSRGPDIYTVEVETATHDDLKAGETATQVSRVQVVADDETTATLAASQMVYGRTGRMPTRATVIDPRQLAAEEAERQAAMRALSSPLAFNPLSVAMAKRRLPGDPQPEVQEEP